MTWVNDAGVVSISARLTLPDGQDMVNVWHAAYIDAEGLPVQDVLDDILQFTEGVYNGWVDHLGDTVDFADVTIYEIGEENTFPPQAWPSLVDGDVADTVMPAGSCVLALLSTGTKGIVGRKYLGGFTEAAWGAGGWGLAFRGEIESSLAYFAGPQTLTNGVSITGGVFSPTKGQFYSISSIRVLKQARYQRRRRLGSGS